jgi:hypothetical protein
MAFPNAAGVPSMSGTYIPQVWSSQLLVKFYANTCLTKIANTRHEGEVKDMGDKVNIRTVPSIIVRDYQIDAELDYQTPNSGLVELTIDKGKYWAYSVNEVQEKQADIEYVKTWANDASKQLKISVEVDVLQDIYNDAAADNYGATAGAIEENVNLGVSGTAVTLTKDNIIDKITEVNQVLTEQNVDEEDRFIVLPAWAITLLKQSDLRNADQVGDGQKSMMRSGWQGTLVDGTEVFRSNLLLRTSDTGYKTNIIAGQKSALTFAAQLVKDEVLTNPKTFGKLHRGLKVFGYKVVKPEALVWLYAAPASA